MSLHVRLDTNWLWNRHMVAVGQSARLLYLGGLSYCVDHLSDGLIPKNALGRIADVDDRNPRASAAKLVEAGRWIDRGDAWEVHDYANPEAPHAVQQSREDVEAKRSVWRQKKARSRAVTRESVPMSPGDSPVVSPEVSRGESPEIPYTDHRSQITDEEKQIRRKSESPDVGVVFDRWRDRLSHPQAKLDAKRKGCIERALRTHGIETVLAAIEGCASSPFHLGENDRGMRYDDLTLILRDATKIEQFAAMSLHPSTRPARRSTGVVAANRAAGEAWRRKHLQAVGGA